MKKLFQFLLATTLLAACGTQKASSDRADEALASLATGSDSRGVISSGTDVDIVWGRQVGAGNDCVKWILDLGLENPNAQLVFKKKLAAEYSIFKYGVDGSNGAFPFPLVKNDVYAFTTTYGAFDGVRVNVPADGGAIIFRYVKALNCKDQNKDPKNTVADADLPVLYFGQASQAIDMAQATKKVKEIKLDTSLMFKYSIN